MVTLDDGTEVRVDVLVVGAGRRPGTDELGGQSAGVEFDEHGAARVDASCRAAAGVWEIGDVTGVMPITHVGKSQAWVAAANILGTPASPATTASPGSCSASRDRRSRPTVRIRTCPGGSRDAVWTDLSGQLSRLLTDHRLSHVAVKLADE